MNKVLFFAFLRDAVGQVEIMLDAVGETIHELKTVVAETYKLTKMETVMTAINEELAPDWEVVKVGDLIAFIPLVSGG
jgi:molybdopterin synthase sulfur carrier subunit